MTDSSAVQCATLSVNGETMKAWAGGEGDPLVLVHGGWGGASSHWSGVWSTLARDFRVIAPELPGFGGGSPAGPRTFGDYARWVERLLDAMGIGKAWLVGNSFGSSVAWRLASQSPERCLGLVVVNGSPPPPPVSPRARWLLEHTPLGRLRTAVVRSMVRRMGYGPAALEKAFADPRLAPEEIARAIGQRSPPQLDLACAALLGHDDPTPTPRAPLLLLWGESDRTFGADAKAARRLHRSLPGSRIAWIPSGAHLPQVERPEEFIGALVRFVETVRREESPSRPAEARPAG